MEPTYTQNHADDRVITEVKLSNAAVAPRGATVQDLAPRASKARYWHLTWLPFVWMMQYGMVIPTLWCTNMFIAALRISTKLGIAGIVCLCIPVVGWIMLAVMGANAMSHREKRHHSYPTTPWGKHLLEA